jgi:hypothetical protein
MFLFHAKLPEMWTQLKGPQALGLPLGLPVAKLYSIRDRVSSLDRNGKGSLPIRCVLLCCSLQQRHDTRGFSAQQLKVTDLLVSNINNIYAKTVN